MSLRHAKASVYADGPDTTKVLPSDWNADHIFSGGALGSLLMRDTGVSDGASWIAAVAVGAVLVSGGVGAAPAWSATPSLTSLTLSTPLVAGSGGTGFGSYAVGDQLYASGAAALSKLSAVAVGSVLVSGGVGAAPAWSSTPTLTDLTLTTLKLGGNAFLVSDAANAVAQRNGANGQAMRWYESFTDASNYARLGLSWDGTRWKFEAESAGTGVLRSIRIAQWWTFNPATGTLLGGAGAFGYTTGAGGSQTQGTSKATTVVLNTATGAITMHAAALDAAAKVSFTVTNSVVAIRDTVVVNVGSGGTASAYRAAVTAIGAGSFVITVENITGGSLSEAPVINFAVVKGSGS